MQLMRSKAKGWLCYHYEMPGESTSKDLRWHLGHLDSLRGIAVLGVVIVHSAYNIHLSRRLAMLASTGQRGVQLFFIVSAFTLFMSYDNRRDEHHPDLNFFLRRLFRLAPMFWVATAIACILTPQYVGPPPGVLLSLVFLHGFSPQTITSGAIGGWSVATEAIFYMCLPLLFRTIRSLWSAIWLLFISAPACYYLGMVLNGRYPKTDYFSFFWFPVNIPVFAMGIVAYLVWKRYIAASRKLEPPNHPELSAIFLGLSALLYKMLLPFSYTNLNAASMVGALLLIALSLHPWPLLVNRLTIFLGRISFSIYLLHFYILRWLLELVRQRSLRDARLGAHPAAQFALLFAGTLLLTVPLSALAWRFIETPGIRLGRRLIAHLEGRALRRKAELVPPFRAVVGPGNSQDAQF
jgi:peptidoglycan/LPS O-acetylase OafA/YrhL